METQNIETRNINITCGVVWFGIFHHSERKLSIIMKVTKYKLRYLESVLTNRQFMGLTLYNFKTMSKVALNLQK